MTIAYYNGGVRVVDLAGLEGISLGGVQFAGQGMREVASFRFENSDTWSFKTPRRPTRRLLRLRQRHPPRARRLPLHAAAAPPSQAGRWLTPVQALALPRHSLTGYRLNCLI